MDNFRHKKQLGQNFLKDKNIARKIVNAAEISNADIVWEVGPGQAILTEFLAEQTQNLTIFEIDERLITDLESQYNKIRIVNQDILRVDWQKEMSKNKIKIVSNLPYQITSPFLFRTVENIDNIDCVVVMIQREVADRINAQPNNKSYGILTLKMQFYYEVEFLFGVKRHLFIPQPNVDSAVIKLIPRKDRPAISDLILFWKIVETSFRNRRKMLRRNLRQIVSKEKIEIVEEKSGIDLRRRGESLNEEEFLLLYDAIVAIG